MDKVICLDRLEDLVLILRNEDGALSDEDRQELQSEKQKLEAALADKP